MRMKGIALAVLLGLMTPAIAETFTPAPAVAQLAFPAGNFSDDTWYVSLWFDSNAYYYRGENLRTGRGLSLAGATVSGDRDRPVYTWTNGQYQYRIAWQPADPNVVRLVVVAPNGNVILNRLLTRDL